VSRRELTSGQEGDLPTSREYLAAQHRGQPAGGAFAGEDPHLWLELDSPVTRNWQDQQNAHTTRLLRDIPWLDDLEAECRESINAAAVSAPRPAGGKWYWLKERAGQPLLLVSSDPLESAGAKSILEPFVQAKYGTAVGFAPSPDGSFIAFSTTTRRSAGRETFDELAVFVAEVATGTVLAKSVPHASTATLSWTPDSRGFFVSAAEAPEPQPGSWRKHLTHYRVDGSISREPLSANPPRQIREAYTLSPQVSRDGRHLFALTSLMSPRPDFVRPLPRGDWVPFLDQVPGRVVGFADGDAYYAITTLNADRGRLVRIPLATGGDPTTWDELVPESSSVLWALQEAGSKLVLTRLHGNAMEISVLDYDGREISQVPLPGSGAVQTDARAGFGIAASVAATGAAVHADTSGITFVFSTPDRAPSIYRYDFASRELRSRSTHSPKGKIVVDAHVSGGRDEATVESSVVRRADADPISPQPTLIFAYGACNVAFIPAYLGALKPFVDAGGVLVLPHLRGGGELGEQGWTDGRLANKQNTFDDLYTVAETLLEEGRTRRDCLALAGASAGGLLAAAAAVQRPDLFAAIAALSPLTDMLRFAERPYFSVSIDEFGDPQDPEQAKWLYAYSPYHNIPTRAIPAIFIWAAKGDVRCPAWYSRKFAAKLQRNTTNSTPILLRVAPTNNHDGALTDAHSAAEWLAFLMNELGMKAFSARDRGGN
jgi:prolyl oligopeptidase